MERPAAGIVRLNSILPACASRRGRAPLFLLRNHRRSLPDSAPKMAYTYLPRQCPCDGKCRVESVPVFSACSPALDGVSWVQGGLVGARRRRPGSFDVFQEPPRPFSRERSLAQAVRDGGGALHEGGIVGGEAFAVDASMIVADAHRRHGVASCRNRRRPPACRSRLCSGPLDRSARSP